MTITYSVAIDRDDDGSFSGEDITTDVLALRWRRGLAQAHDSMAEPGTAQITVRNPSQAYSPEVTTLQPGMVVRIQSDDGSTVRTHFTGHITRVEPLPGDQGRRTAVIHAVDAADQLRHSLVGLPPQMAVRADEVIESILVRFPFRRTKLKGYWALGTVDHSELSSNTRLPIPGITRSLESGKTTFAYVGDTWGDGIPASTAIYQVVEAERGRFFIDSEGQAVFYNRHHLLEDTTSQAAFADDMAAMTYDYGGDVVSHVRVRLLPRGIGASGTDLWRLEKPQRIPAGGELQIIARFRDDLNQPVGALDITPPVPVLDYLANAQEDGSGSDQTSHLVIILRQVDFSAALLEIRNQASRDVYLMDGARLRGTPVYSGDPLFIEQVSYGSLTFYSPQALLFDLPALDSVDQAVSLARYELARRKTPRGHVRTLTLSSVDHAAQIIERSLFDRITVQESQTGHDADYFIVAEAHEVDLGGQRHHVTWTLESANANRFWVLGYSHLNQDSVLAY